MPYYDNRGRKWKFILFILLLITLMVGFIYKFGYRFSWTSKLYDKLHALGISNSDSPNTPSQETYTQPLWCKLDEFGVDNDIELPERDRIIGWDSDFGCCLREVQGYNCALKKEAIMHYCYTSQVGGEIKYVLINDIRVGTNYKDFYDDFDKQYIENKQCDINKYPMSVR